MNELETLFPNPTEIDLRPQLKQKGESEMEIGFHHKMIMGYHYTVGILAIIGLLSTAYGVGCTLAPDKFVYPGLKGLDPETRLFVQGLVDTCGSKNIFNPPIDNCKINTRDLVMFKTGYNTPLTLSVSPPGKKDNQVALSVPPMAPTAQPQPGND